MQPKQIVLDLDNTLYNWVDVILPAIRCMIQAASTISGISEAELFDDLRRIHIKKGTIEHPFALLEASSVVNRYGNLSGRGADNPLDKAFHAFNSYRHHNLSLYPGVLDFLVRAQAAGVSLIAFSEAQVNAVADRVARLGLMKFFGAIYCVAPRDFNPTERQRRWLDERLNPQKLHLLDYGVKKPSPLLLLKILEAQEASRHSTIYVGDSLHRDVAMANDAGVFSAWAKYGTIHKPENAALLLRVTHWTDEEVEHFQATVRHNVAKPKLTLERSLEELAAFCGV